MAAVVLAVLATAACGSSSSGSRSGAQPVSESKAPVKATGATCTAEDIKVGGAAGARPSITIPEGCAPPATLLSKDLTVGSGAEVKDGATMDTHYVLKTWSDKKELDASWNRGEPFALKNVGHAGVIKGWNEGLIGMKQGGRRLLIVPPDKGYGAGGNGIAPNETLVFVIDAVKVS